MNVSELETRFRHDVGDQVRPYLFSSPDFLAFLNEAERQACERSDLLIEDTDASMCQHVVRAGAQPRELHELFTRVTKAVWITPDDSDGQPQRTELRLVVDRRVLDRESSTWRYDSGVPSTLLIEGDKLRLVQKPDADGTLYLEGFRLPREPMSKPTDEPEIPSIHHLKMLKWAVKLAFERPDSETRDPGRAQAADDEFSAYFGPARDASQWQETEDAPPVNRVFL